MADDLVFKSDEVDLAVSRMLEAIASLPLSDQALNREKFFVMVRDDPARLFRSEWEYAATASTVELRSNTLKPSQFFLDAISAVGAGKLDWDIE